LQANGGRERTRLGSVKKKEEDEKRERKTEMILVKHTYRVFEFKEHNKQLRTRIKIKKGQVWNARSAVHIHTAHGTVREREGRERIVPRKRSRGA
jgi:hypothetical protein